MRKFVVRRPGGSAKKVLRTGALFCGIGGFCSGFEAAGFRTSWANENDPYACEVYRRNFPKNRLIEKDVRKLSVAKDHLQPVDVLHAGFPCQSFSQAGVRAGFEDDRGKLFFEIIRIVKEFGEKKPRVIVLENAPFLTMGEGGVWFLEIARQLQRAGYWFRDSNAQVLDLFQLSNVPQKRARLFMVAWSIDHFQSGRFKFPEVNSPPKKDPTKFIDFKGEQNDLYYLPTDNRYYKMISKEKVDTRSVKHVYQLRKYFVRQKEPGICPTLTANMGHGGHNVPFIWDSAFNELGPAKENLRCREGMPSQKGIGFVDLITRKQSSTALDRHPIAVSKIRAWADLNGRPAVIWTALASNFQSSGKANEPFSVEAAIRYLETRDAKTLRSALTYIRQAPPEIQTPVREAVEKRWPEVR